MTVETGLDQLINNTKLQNKITGNFAYLCHAASVSKNLTHGVVALKEIFSENFKKIFGPQHGFVSDVQDNMIESDHYQHPFFELPVYSLYSETRIPTDEMLADLDHVIIDLQDVGTRIYTYIYTMTHTMEACAKKGIEVIVLDRPNPIGCETIEGNVLDTTNFASFVGRHALPCRHAMTIGEIALWANEYCDIGCKLQVISMKNYHRSMYFEDTGLPWVLPSPNLPTVDGCFTFVGTVLFEGTNISEGRGTTRALEIIGHPDFEPFANHSQIMSFLDSFNISGFKLRPLYFQPTFQKHAKKTCGGFQIHINDRKAFRPWTLSQALCQYFYRHIKDFSWKQPPYEYEYDRLPIDLINGSDSIRQWIEKSGAPQELLEIEQIGRELFIEQKQQAHLY